jgi:flagellar biosynthesis chaperone FliJ
MNYSFETLTTIAECEEYVNECGREKITIENRKNNLQDRMEENNGSGQLVQGITNLNMQIDSLQTMIDQLPEGEDPTSLQKLLADMYQKRQSKERKLKAMGNHWKIELVREYNSCDDEIASFDDLIAQVNTHKATLAA